MNKEIIIKALKRYPYPENQIERVAEQLMLLDGSLIPLLENWALQGIETDFSIENFTLVGLKDKYDMTYPAALLTMDWLIKEPAIAKRAISKGIK